MLPFALLTWRRHEEQRSTRWRDSSQYETRIHYPRFLRVCQTSLPRCLDIQRLDVQRVRFPIATTSSNPNPGCTVCFKQYQKKGRSLKIFHSELSCDTRAMKLYDCRTGNRDTYVPRAHTSWGIASTPGVVSRVHSDTTGLCTVSQPMTGEKYWAVASPRPDSEDTNDGDVMKYKQFDDDHIDKRYRWEAVSLTNQTALYVFIISITFCSILTS